MTFVEQRELLIRNKVPADHLDDRAAFRCLTLSKAKPTAPAKSETEALAQQQRQIAERAKQQREHEQALLSSLKETRESSAVSADAAASRVTEELRAVILAESTQREYQVSCTQRQVEECIHESRQHFTARLEVIEKGLDAVYRSNVLLSKEQVAAAERITDYADMIVWTSMKRVMVAIGVIGLILLLATLASAQQANVNPGIVGAPATPYSGRSPLQTDANGAVVIVAGSTAITVSGTVTATITTSGLATSSNQTTLNTQTTKINDGTDTALVSAAGALLTDASATTQPISGTVAVTGITSSQSITVFQPTGTNLHVVPDSGTITTVGTVTTVTGATISNGAGAAAVNIQDGGNAITVDGTVAVSGVTGTVTVDTSNLATSALQTTGNTSLSTLAGAVSGTEMQVDVVTSALPTGAATAANQTTANTSLSTIAGAVSGTEMQVDVLTMPSVTIGTFPDNEPFNVAQINGVTPLMGNGVTGTGSQRVTIASDNTAFTVNTGTFPDNEPFNLAQVGSTSIVSAVTAGTVSTSGAIVETNPPAATAGTWRGLSMTPTGAIRQEIVPSGVSTYSAAGSASLAATASDFWTITGSATCTIYVMVIDLTSTQTTFAQEEVSLIRRSTVDSGGSSTALTAVPHDTTNPAATATVNMYTANPTLGTAVGNVTVQQILVPATNSQGGNSSPFSFVPRDLAVQPLVLRGTSEQLALSYEGATVAGEIMRVTARWREVCP